MGQDCGGWAGFEDLALAHDGNPVGHLADDGEVVAGEDHGESGFALEGLEQIEHLGLDGYVEGGGGFVGDEQLWLVDQGHGDEDALALSAGELVRVVAESAGGIGDGDGFEGGDGLAFGFFCGLAGVGLDGFGDLTSDGHDRVEGGHRLLEDHGDFAASDRLQGAVGK